MQYYILMNIQYTLIRTNRKSIGIRISDTGEVIVRAPRRTPVQEIEAVLVKHTEWIEKNKRRTEDRQAQLDRLDQEQTEQLRQLAKVYLTKKTEYFAALMGLTYNKITITSAKKRLGSCSTGGSICYSLYLLLYPDAAVDYVVVHELCHLKQMNHSKKFWKEVERYMPDYQNYKKWLNENGGALIERMLRR